MRFAIYTLGCKVNQYETQAMETILQQRGHTLTDFHAPADAYIVNTCSVTAVSDKKCRNMLRRVKKLAPDSVLAVCGCYAQAKPEEVAALGADVVYGTGKRLEFLDAVEQAVAQRRQRLEVDDALRRKSPFEVLPAGGLPGRTRALLKVEDGCANFCTYCIIPYTRGPVRSEPLEDAVAQAKGLAQAGYQEIVVTGIEISSWGKDLPGDATLIDLLEAVCRAVPDLRIRMGSLEPRTVTEDFCRLAAALPNLCPHFHLSLQSGCDATLKRMNRRYDTARFLKSCRLLRQWFDRPAITTDLICGFAGETAEEFAETLAFLPQAQFSAMHIFPYSRRSGTVADRLPGQLPNAVKEERCHQAAAVARALQEDYLNQFVGETLPVLFEETAEGAPAGVGLWRGHAPNYVEVYAWGQDLHNVLRSVAVERVAEGSRLEGSIAAEEPL
ncbi:MAG: tRNA (N(6)-L-threonylcarbamoyladenosine(37)-C(2))-methylthiotransferase MtaB [Clostridiales bacterium]|nr:tRNA (N(6)-L-threonylcarbamoyladenosine(37)-C(2))-methylthiotransferase MtaB [Clostridiales bacterium]